MNRKTKKTSFRPTDKKAGSVGAKPRAKRSLSPDTLPRDKVSETLTVSTVSQATQEHVVTPLTELSIPLSSKAVFWPPRHGALSKDIFHVPLIFWLVETMRPARVLQLGLQDPGSYLAVCQAMDRLGLEGQCWVLASAGEADSLGAARQEQHDQMYGDFSSILTRSHERTSRSLRGMGIDLLIVDMPSNDPNFSVVCDLWLPLLSERGVIVLKDVDAGVEDENAFQALFDTLTQGYPMFRSQYGDRALHIILHGDNQPERLRHLAELDLGMPGNLAVRQVFSRLGQGLVDGQALQRIRIEKAKMECEASALKARVSELEASVDTERNEAVDAKSFAQQLQGQYNERQADLFDLERDRDNAKAATAALQEARDHAQAEAAKLRDEINKLKDGADGAQKEAQTKIEKLQSALTEAEQARSQVWADFDQLREEQDEKTAVLTSRVADKDKALTALRADLEKAQQARDAANSECEAAKNATEKALAALRTDLEKAQQARDAAVQAAEKAQEEFSQHLETMQDQIEAMQKERFMAQQSVGSLRAELDGERLVWETRARELTSSAEAATETNSDLRKKLDQALERRQAIWQAHEMLKATHLALRAQIEQTPSSDTAAD